MKPLSSPRSARLAGALAVLLLSGFGATGCGDEEQDASGAPPGPGAAEAIRQSMPTPGSYRYRTTGFERVKAESVGAAPVLAGRLRYPRVSTISIRRSGCGMSERWRAGPRRSTISQYCLRPGRRQLRGLTDVHEFLDQPFRLRYSCTGPAVPVPQRIRVGLRWTDRCSALGARVVAPQRVLGIERIRVAGRTVRAVHYRAEPRLTGVIRGDNRIDSWFSRKDGLLVKRVVRSSTSVRSPIGEVQARERYELGLR